MENNSKKKVLNVSGYRGVWGQDLDEQITFRYASAFAQTIKKKGGSRILVGRDGRPSGLQMLRAIKQAFEISGVEFIYAGIIPTPSMLMLVKKLSCDGGVIITASHNPKEYNGMKFLGKTGLFSTQEEIDDIEKEKSNISTEIVFVEDNEDENFTIDNEEFRRIHINEVLTNIDTALIKSKKIKVALDSINSSGSIITKELLRELGCEVFIINGKQDGEYTHMPEPRPENLKEIGDAVIQNNADIGFAQDPDADRLVVVNEKGHVLNEEYTLALAFKAVLADKKGSVVMNLSTSSVSEEVARSLGSEVYRSKIGEPHVVDMIIEKGAIVGGEGNGGVIYPKINLARDSLVGIGLILELIAKENRKISEIADDLPKYFMKKEKVPYAGHLDSIYNNVKQKFPDAEVNETEGLRLSWSDLSWVHIRPSNTEPIVRIFGEAKAKERIDSLFEDVMFFLRR